MDDEIISELDQVISIIKHCEPCKVLDIAMDAWDTEYGEIRQEGNKYNFVTGGWSDNEAIIAAMSENKLFWAIHWYSTTVGGSWVFRCEEK